MNLWLRALKVLIWSFFRPRLSWSDESRVWFRVWPNDLDINIHMNNGRYMSVMDLGRFDIILRTGLWRLVTRRRLQPVIASAMVRYRRPLAPFERFTLSTRLIGWDSKWLYIEHRLERRGELVCHGVVRGTFLERSGSVPPAELAAALGHDAPSPPLPPWVAEWQAVERAQKAAA